MAWTACTARVVSLAWETMTSLSQSKGAASPESGACRTTSICGAASRSFSLNARRSVSSTGDPTGITTATFCPLPVAFSSFTP